MAKLSRDFGRHDQVELAERRGIWSTILLCMP